VNCLATMHVPDIPCRDPHPRGGTSRPLRSCESVIFCVNSLVDKLSLPAPAPTSVAGPKRYAALAELAVTQSKREERPSNFLIVRVLRGRAVEGLSEICTIVWECEANIVPWTDRSSDAQEQHPRRAGRLHVNQSYRRR